ncbi:tRNA guanosine-2'-O-methyltransferase [Coleophoma crateriformis]|uniref:tRNA (guanine(10)-N(2))-methyltransferase n=1 Tax=Coleophoma crateriformis TaxID=565419 RepID=A0A3D8RD35_9HELO|nr:tRNA guanosine-2'-O-methyltransferase [Coleophoma crateriformis]
MEYMIRFSQSHETFRLAEIEALAVLEGIKFQVTSYSASSPFCFFKTTSEDAAIRLVKRSILAKCVYEVWGTGLDYEALHENVVVTSQNVWAQYKTQTFKFFMDTFQGSRSIAEQRELIEEFRYLGFTGPVRMKKPEQEFCILEHWPFENVSGECPKPSAIHLGRYLGGSERDAIQKYDLKKRKYISTTSMDSELALVTANLTLASPGKLFYDPFVGTGSFPIACAHFGAIAWGSDIDGRSIRGKGKTNLYANFEQYDLKNEFGDSFVADLTNTPLRATTLFDGIVCDPPYGVREGLKVLGSRDPTKGKEIVYQDGIAHHLQAGYIPPKRPYSFLAMLDDILDFAALSLVPNGRLSFWMPTSNDQDEEIHAPTHPCLEMKSICTQSFNRWSRRLITYRRIPDSEVVASIARNRTPKGDGVSADDLNPFRKRYFEGFRPS